MSLEEFPLRGIVLRAIVLEKFTLTQKVDKAVRCIFGQLDEYKVLHSCLPFMYNYLNSTTQRFNISIETIPYSQLKTSVPQRTVLGRIMFLAKMNTIANLNETEGLLLCCTDDTE